ncbi:membrane protein [Actinomadura sp. NBRC 104412]|uniref:O-antigen ligase family protein n=1 Tax=Actinomadura sp. NBRC 104412 TaxID=3032203 RepID=UPI0024A2E6D0|nr:O-antigen ligase family protein [Actinomadura sp. NBRC 104412]GLZ06040.1 membrane protein [Actinomadura sp. NBRC 104412]
MTGASPLRPGLLVAAAVLTVCVPEGPLAETGARVGVQVHPSDVAGLLLVFAATVAVLSGVSAPPRRALWAFGPLVVAAGLATLCSPDITASLPGFIRVVQLFVLVPLAVLILVRDRRDALIAAGGVVAAGLIEGCYGIWQARTGNGASYAGENVRAVGTFGGTDVMALSVVAGLALVITLSFLLAGPWRLRLLAPAALLVLAAALALGLSRGAWIAIGAAAVLVLFAYSVRLALWTAVTAVSLLIVLAGGLGVGPGFDMLADRTRSLADITDAPDQSVVDRYSLWTAASGMWQDHPITGVGVKNFPAYRDTYAPIELSSAGEVADDSGYRRQPLLSPHNQYMLFLSEQGVLGLAGLLTLFGTLLYGVCAHRSPRDPLWLASAGLLTALLIDFLYSDLGGAGSVLVSIVIGLIAAGPTVWRRPGSAQA